MLCTVHAANVRKQKREAVKVFRGFEQVAARVGRRFAQCSFKNFDVGSDKHTAVRRRVLKAVEQYARNLRENVQAGRNLVIRGPVGTGKDHLAASVVRVALGLSIDCVCIRGSDLCAQMRSHYLEHNTAVPVRLARTELLVISDIEPSANGCSDFEERAILELLDVRYRELRPTIVTTNADTDEKLAAVIGLRALDRLHDGALVVTTCWPSYRGKQQHA